MSNTGCAASKFTNASAHAALCDCQAPACADCGETDREGISYIAPSLWLCGACEGRRADHEAELVANCDPGCYACEGTARVRGWGRWHGTICTCVRECDNCGSAYPSAIAGEVTGIECPDCEALP